MRVGPIRIDALQTKRKGEPGGRRHTLIVDCSTGPQQPARRESGHVPLARRQLITGHVMPIVQPGAGGYPS
jgi:hypothetical protein